MDWPVWVDSKPEGFRHALDKLVADTKELLSKRNNFRAEYGDSRISREAKDLSAAASNLLKEVRRFHDNIHLAEADNFKDDALKHLSEQLKPDEPEQGLIKAAFSPHSLQWVLLGLSVQMDFISDSTNKEGGRKPMILEQWATDQLLELSNQVGISMGRSGSRQIADLFDAFFTNAGIDSPPSERFLTDRKKAYKETLDS